MGDSDDVTIGRCRVVLPSAQPMYRVAERWRDEALIEDHSLFSGEPLAGAAAAQELVEAFVLQPDIGAGTFYEKLEQQLEGVSPAAIQLAAELMFVYFLIVTTGAVKPETKRQHVRSGQSPTNLPSRLSSPVQPQALAQPPTHGSLPTPSASLALRRQAAQARPRRCAAS